MATKDDFTQLVEALWLAMDGYESASRDASIARNKEVDTLNKLNELQKKFDTTVDMLRKEAPQSTDWASKLRCKGQIKQ